MAAVDLFLEIDGIAGESTDKAHRDAIEAVAFSWAEHLSASGGTGGGGGVGKVQFGELQVVARTSVASPFLMASCASGRHHATARLSVRRRGDKAKDHLVLALTDVTVNGYRVGANESGDDDTPTDQISLAFGRIEYTYTPVDARGRNGTPVTATWDVAANAPAATTRAATAPAPTAGRTRKKTPA